MKLSILLLGLLILSACSHTVYRKYPAPDAKAFNQDYVDCRVKAQQASGGKYPNKGVMDMCMEGHGYAADSE